MQVRESSLIKNTSILSFGTLCTKGIMFILTPLYTRWLSLEDYGTFDLLATYVTLLLPLITLASGDAVFRFVLNNRSEIDNKEVISSAFFIDIVGLIVVYILGTIYGVIVNNKWRLIYSFLFYLSTEVVYNFVLMGLRGEKKLNIYTLGNILFVLDLFFFVPFFVLFCDLELVGMLLGYAVSNVIAIFNMLMLSNIYKRINITFISLQKIKEMLVYSLPMIPNAISWWVINASDRTLINIYLGASYNAIYAISNKIPALCNTFFNVFHLSWQQNAIETLDDEDRDGYYSSIMNHMLCIISSICIVVLGVNYWYFHILFTEEYFQGIFQVPILVLAIIFSMMGQFIGSINVALMKAKKNSITTLVAASVNVGINYVLINSLELYAASISTLFAYVILFSVRYFDIKKEINLRIYKDTFWVLIVLLYFVVTSLITIEALQTINFFCGIFCFVGVNYSYFYKILRRIVSK